MFAALFLALLLTTTSGYSFTALYAFGDSLSDTGRNPASPPTSYFNGRYSNGPLWVEYLSALLGITYNASNNFAVSGSTTSNLLSQISGLRPSANLHSGLFSVWSGGNDFLLNAGLGTNDSAWSNVISNAVLNLTNAVGALFTNGAREIIVGNLPNLGQLPFLATSPAGFPAYVDSKVAAFNTMLASGLTNLMQRNAGLRVYLADNNALFASILNAPATYGFTVTTNGALEDPSLTNKSFTGPGANYVFWDVVHPTTKLHAMIAAAAFQDVAVQLNITPSGTKFNLKALNLYPGLPYTIQTSTNLPDWTNYQTFTASGTNATTVVTNGPGPKAFFQVTY